jgi:uncharacterized LabA/DUF88 family protein
MEETDAIKLGALFVDLENVYFALLNPPFSLRRDAALSAAMDGVNAVRRRLRDEGYALVVERSYADWEQLPSTAQRQLQISGVLPRFADSRVDKNTADIELSLDILQTILTRAELRHVVLVGGDRDYLPILRRMKEMHRSIHVCSLRSCLAGDVREFVANYPPAAIIELDDLVTFADYERKPNADVERAATTSADPSPAFADTGEATEWHERYLEAILRFMQENRYREVYLAPFFRWLRTDKSFTLKSVAEQRHLFSDLTAMGALTVEERDGGQGHSFSVAFPNYNHPLVQKVSNG